MHTRRVRSELGYAVVAVATVAVLVSACSSSGGSPSNTTTKGGVDLDTASIAQLKTIACQEGTLVEYDSSAATDAQKEVDAFEKAYPCIKIKDISLSASDAVTRILTEERGGKYLADLAGGPSTLMSELRLAGAYEPYTPQVKIPEPKGLGVAANQVSDLDTEVVAYNPTVLKEHNIAVPTTWSDFTKPEWKGHFSVDTEAIDWYAGLIAEYGHAKALKLLTDIGNNDPVPVTSHSQAVVDLEAGSPWATATSYGYIAEQYHQKDPTHVAFVNFNPVLAAPDQQVIPKNAPDPAAARLYINWSLTKDGQQTMVDTIGLQSLRSDVKQDPNVWNPAKWTPLVENTNLTADQINTYQKEFQTALHVSS